MFSCSLLNIAVCKWKMLLYSSKPLCGGFLSRSVSSETGSTISSGLLSVGSLNSPPDTYFAKEWARRIIWPLFVDYPDRT